MSQQSDTRNTGSSGTLVKWLLALGAIGEVGVGIGMLAFPAELVGLLVGEPVVGAGLLLARLFGVAVIALGLAWWTAKGTPRGCRETTPGFLVYNLGVAAMIALYALSAAKSMPLLWPVAVLHAALGLAFVTAALKRRHPI